MNADCMVWQGLTMGRTNAESLKAFSAVDEIDAQMIEMARAVVADPRRRESVESDCPQLFAQMVELAQKPRRTRSLLTIDDVAEQLRNWSESDLESLHRAIDAELHRRRANDA